jgi:hypothetical protein
LKRQNRKQETDADRLTLSVEDSAREQVVSKMALSPKPRQRAKSMDLLRLSLDSSDGLENLEVDDLKGLIASAGMDSEGCMEKSDVLVLMHACLHFGICYY